MTKFSTVSDNRPGKFCICPYFCILLVLELIFFLYAVMSWRMPSIHDGFQYFSLQYYFFNHQVIYGDIPQWMPFMTHGTVASWWYTLQACVAHNALGIAAGVFKHINFIPVFHIGVLVDRLIFLIGIWLWGTRLFSSKQTNFFVSVTVMMSCIWMSQFWFNFHFYYTIPLMLYFGHRFFETGQWRYVVLGGNLLFLQFLSTLPYQIGVVTLVSGLYFIFHFAFNHREFIPAVKRIRWFSLNAAGSLALIIILFAGLFYILKNGTAEIITYNPGRNPDGSITLHGFLTFAGDYLVRPWTEILSGLSPALDYTLFMGILTVPLIVLGAFFGGRKSAPVTVLITILLLFSSATWVANFFYYAWPMMKYYRHLSLILPVIKLFLCVLAGFGFEYIFLRETAPKNKNSRKNVMTAMVIYFGVMAFVFGYCCINPEQAYRAAEAAVDVVTKHFTYTPSERSVGMGMLNGAVFSFLLLVMGMFALNDKVQKYTKLIVSGFLVLQTCHMAVYYTQQLTDRTTSVPAQLRDILSFQEMPFAEQRQEFIENSRSQLIFLLKRAGMIYWSTHSFIFLDQVHNHFRTDHWLKPLDQYMRAYWGYPLEKENNMIEGLNIFRHLTFPLEHQASGKIAGFTESKLQFFTKAFFANSPQDAAGQIADADYHGDVLILSHSKGNAQELPVMTSRAELAEDSRLKIPYKVESFSANQLTVTVDVPENQSSPVWMLYSDVWHPGWRAEVNGQPVLVYQANLAYKTVSLVKGKNTIRFFFSSKLATIIQTVIQWNSLLWLVLMVVLLKNCLSAYTEEHVFR